MTLRNSALYEAVEEELVSLQGRPAKLASSGRERVFDCPFCDHKQKLTINPDKGVFNCWTCGGEFGFTRGSIEKLARMLGIDTASILGDMLSEEGLEEALNGTPTLMPVVPNNDDLPIAPPPNSRPLDFLAQRYLTMRGMTVQEIHYYRPFLGTICGVHRIFFPDFNAHGQVRYWQGRTYLPTDMHRRDKYVAPDRNLVQRGGKLYDWHRAIKLDFPYIVLTEGPLSKVAAGPAAVAQWGKDWTDEQLALLCRCRNKIVCVAYDGDAYQQTLRMTNLLKSAGVDARPVAIPYGKDPDSVGREQFQQAVVHALQDNDGALSVLQKIVQSL